MTFHFSRPSKHLATCNGDFNRTPTCLSGFQAVWDKMLFSDSIPHKSWLPLFELLFIIYFFFKPNMFGSRLRDLEVKVMLYRRTYGTFSTQLFVFETRCCNFMDYHIQIDTQHCCLCFREVASCGNHSTAFKVVLR